MPWGGRDLPPSELLFSLGPASSTVAPVRCAAQSLWGGDGPTGAEPMEFAVVREAEPVADSSQLTLYPHLSAHYL